MKPVRRHYKLNDDVINKVRILAGKKGTSAVTRVLVSTQDDDGRWDTLGVHEHVIAASWTALAEALTYGLLRSGRSN